VLDDHTRRLLPINLTLDEARCLYALAIETADRAPDEHAALITLARALDDRASQRRCIWPFASEADATWDRNGALASAARVT
jgi:hypothetical protein